MKSVVFGGTTTTGGNDLLTTSSCLSATCSLSATSSVSPTASVSNVKCVLPHLRQRELDARLESAPHTEHCFACGFTISSGPHQLAFVAKLRDFPAT